jgi:hypothetical protein
MWWELAKVFSLYHKKIKISQNNPEDLPSCQLDSWEIWRNFLHQGFLPRVGASDFVINLKRQMWR